MGLDQCKAFSPPVPGYKSQLFYHEMSANNSGLVALIVFNRWIVVSILAKGIGHSVDESKE